MVVPSHLKNTASSFAHSPTIVLTSTAGTVKRWRLTVGNSLSMSWVTAAKWALFFVSSCAASRWVLVSRQPSHSSYTVVSSWPNWEMSLFLTWHPHFCCHFWNKLWKKNKVQLWVDCPGKYIKTFTEATKKSKCIKPFRWKCWHDCTVQSLDILFLAQ